MLVAMAPANKRVEEIVVVITGEPSPAILEERGDYARILRASVGDGWQGRWRSFDARTGDWRDAGIGDDAALIITGSSANVHTREPWIVASEAALADLVARDVPVLGVCFGHQLLAQALGGEVTPNPRGREMSTVSIERTADDPLLAGLDARFEANACHSDTVARLPDGATVLARSDADPHQALRFAPQCWGVQFHPEFDAQVMKRMIEARREVIASEGLDPDAMHRAARNTPAAARVLTNFLDLCRGLPA